MPWSRIALLKSGRRCFDDSMRPALLLIDCQEDFLASPGLSPSRTRLLANVAELLELFRSQGWGVVHVWTTIRDESEAMSIGAGKACRAVWRAVPATARLPC